MTDYAYEAERRELAKTKPWHSFAIPRQNSSETHCRSPKCPETNWGGQDRIHTRGPECPPLDQADDLSHVAVDFAAVRYFLKEAERQEAAQKVRLVARSSEKGATVVLVQGETQIEMTPDEALQIFRRGVTWLEGAREIDLTP